MRPRADSRIAAEKRGRLAETLCVWSLRLRGWRILARRLAGKRGLGIGEIDIVARRGKVIAFIEVKARRNKADLDTAIDAWRLRRVAAAANALQPRYAPAGEDIRIDVMLIAPFSRPRHIPNAWHG